MSRRVRPARWTVEGRIVRWGYLLVLPLLTYGYPAGWPAWLLLLCLQLPVLVAWSVWVWRGPWQRFRMLWGVAVVLLISGSWELWTAGRIPRSVAESLQLPPGPGEPNLYFEYDFPAVGAVLFPGLAEVLLVQAVQLNYCSSGVPEFSKHPVCLKYPVRNPGAVREALESALRQQPKTNEDVYYSYIEVLRGTGAADSEVEAACAQWRQLFPLSDRPDPLSVMDGSFRR